MAAIPRREKSGSVGSGAYQPAQHAGSTPEYGRRVLINVIDDTAAAEPTKPLTLIPKSSNASDGWRVVTFREMADAIDYWAHQISEATKDATQPFPTLAYIGGNDVRYAIFFLACVKAGCKALFISPRNTTGVQLSLFEATDCNYLFYTKAFHAVMEPCLNQRSMKATTVPDIDEWFKTASAPFPYSRTFEQAQWDPLVVLHTSGSTGTPKPITVRQGSLYIADSYHNLPEYEGSSFVFCEWAKRSERMFLPMPMFHAAGSMCIAISILFGIQMAYPLLDKPVNVDTVLESLAHAGVNGGILPPSIVEELAATEEGIKALTKLAFVAFGGGNLSPVAGKILTDRGAILSNVIGSTEHFPYATFFPKDPQLWRYIVLDDKLMGIDWRPHGDEGYELVIRRKDPNHPSGQACFYTFPDITDSWSTNDIFEPHPTIPNYWLYKGRADDVIVFSTGEKLNPVTIEATVTGHPLVKGVLVVGQERFQAAMILEPQTPVANDEEAEALIEKVWPLIEKANSETVTHGRIHRALVTVSDPTKPFIRAGKGTVQRASTTKLYHDFINSIYERANVSNEEEVIEIDTSGEEPLTNSIINLFASKLEVGGLDASTDFFTHGVDSLQVMKLSKLLRSALEGSGVEITTRVIYQNPNPQKLASHLFTRLNKESHHGHDESAGEIPEMKQILSKLTENLPAPKENKPEPRKDGQTVIITGTTGSLGAYMLDRMCNLPSISKIYALNRGEDGGLSRQPSVNESRGLTKDLSKVQFLGADLSLPDFGLGQKVYNELLANVDRVIHNAWPVNFNISISTFEPVIRGVRNLADFSYAAAKNVPIIFVSSIGTADSWSAAEPVPEKRIDDLSLPQMSYGRSKMLASLILDAAAETSKIPSASVRVGQIAGPRAEAGVWNRQEFIPSLIASSVYLGVLPDSLGPMSEITWTPVEDVAGLILDVAGITTEKQVSEISGYFHAVNPSVMDWSELAPVVKNFYGDRIHKIVSLKEWVSALEASAENTADISKNPASKLIDTYHNFLAAEQQGQLTLRFSMERTKDASPTIRSAGPVTPALMENWCRQWSF